MTTTYQRTHVYTIDDVRAIANHAGSHFFSAKAMQFFKSRVLEGVRALDGNESRAGARFLFVTSECFGEDARHYTLRMMTLETVRDNRPHVGIATVGEYHPTASAARRAMRDYSDH